MGAMPLLVTANSLSNSRYGHWLANLNLMMVTRWSAVMAATEILIRSDVLHPEKKIRKKYVEILLAKSKISEHLAKLEINSKFFQIH